MEKKVVEDKSSDERAKLFTATCMDDMSDELLIEILHRVPCKPAIQCKSVCKRWFHLIQNPYFLTRYFSFQKPQQLLVYSGHNRLDFLTDPPLSDWKISLNFLSLPDKRHVGCFKCGNSSFFLKPSGLDEELENRHVLCSSNGLLLCSAKYHNQTIYFIHNPLTKEWVSIPPAPPTSSSSSYDDLMHVGFVCDPYFYIDKDSHVSIRPNRKFMVVRTPNTLESHNWFYVQVFRSEEGKWFDSKVSTPQQIRMIYLVSQSAVVSNRRMHWLTSDKKLLVYDPYKNRVDFIIPLPASIQSGLTMLCGEGCLYLSSCGGSLRIYGNKNPSFLRVWELNKEKRKWTLKHLFNVGLCSWGPSWLWEFENGGGRRQIIGIHPDDPNVMYWKFHSFKNRKPDAIVASWNFKTRSWKTVIGEHPCHSRSRYTHVFSFSMPLWPTPIPSFPSSYNFAAPS